MKRSVFTGKAEGLAERFSDCAPAVLRFEDPEDVHKMRVTGRTLLTYMDLAADRKERKRRYHRDMTGRIRRSMSLLGKLRDLDVLITELGTRAKGAPPAQARLLEAWITDAMAVRERQRSLVAGELPELVDNWFDELADRWKGRLTSLEAATPEARLKRLRKRLDNAREKVLAHRGNPVTDEDFLDDLHSLRICVKRLRYALATMEKEAGTIEDLKRQQELLGKVQDARVWIRWLDRYRTAYPEAAKSLEAELRADMIKAIGQTGLFSRIDG